MVKEFWNESLTGESWQKLAELSKKYAFILIGGWAAYMWTKTHKSRDVDIVVDFDTLARLRQDYSLSKNDRLAKYEIKFDKFDVDVYVEHFSRLAIPPEELKQFCEKIEGINTVKPEALLVLKQQAEVERRGTPKGEKDAIDLLTLLLNAEIDLKAYARLLAKYGKKGLLQELVYVVSNYDERNLAYLGINFLEFKKWKKAVLEKLRELRTKSRTN